jgi:type I restriction enzyme S subunit
MDSDWRDLTLGEFVRLQRGHDLTASEQRPGQFPVMGSAGQNGNHSEFKAPGPGVVIGRSGASMGRVHYCDEDYWPHNTCIYVTDFLGNNPLFVYYKLSELDLARYNSGSAQPSLNRNYIYGMSLRVPVRRLQDKIVNTIHSMDNKIALNRRINQTLEAMAQALFKSWFVDFDPVKAKIAALAEGRDPLRAAMSVISGKAEAELDALPREQFELLAATAALFPEEMEESELGEIPKGWLTTTLKALTVKIGSGSTPRGGKEVYLDDGAALIRSQNVYDSEFVWDGLARISDDAAAQLKGVEVHLEDVLLNITGASILRTCVVIPDVLPARVNQHVAIIRANDGIPPRYLHNHLLQQKTKDFLLGKV